MRAMLCAHDGTGVQCGAAARACDAPSFPCVRATGACPQRRPATRKAARRRTRQPLKNNHQQDSHTGTCSSRARGRWQQRRDGGLLGGEATPAAAGSDARGTQARYGARRGGAAHEVSDAPEKIWQSARGGG